MPLKRIRKDQTGATAVEYALIGALVFLVALSAMQLLGANTNTMYNKVTNAIVSSSSS
jgi:pilus assembly protein Flp/PilA